VIMISEQDKRTIQKIAEKYKASRVLLFGSSLYSKFETEDIDLAVEGVTETDFFKFYSELIFSLSKPVDLIDLNPRSLFKDIILEEGVVLYG